MGFANGGSLQSPLTAVIRLNSANFDLQIILQQTRNNNTSSQFVYSGAWVGYSCFPASPPHWLTDCYICFFNNNQIKIISSWREKSKKDIHTHIYVTKNVLVAQSFWTWYEYFIHLNSSNECRESKLHYILHSLWHPWTLGGWESDADDGTTEGSAAWWNEWMQKRNQKGNTTKHSPTEWKIRGEQIQSCINRVC